MARWFDAWIFSCHAIRLLIVLVETHTHTKNTTTDLPALTPLFLGAFYIGYWEGWSWSDVIYYCVVTTTSIGYGDLTPIREDTRLFAVMFIPLVRSLECYRRLLHISPRDCGID